MTRELHRTCIVCPRGCALTISVDDPGTGATPSVVVEGNDCSRGEDYGLEEATTPVRVLTTTVRTTSTVRPRLPVRTDTTVPLDAMLELMAQIDDVCISAPVHCGQVIVPDLGGTGANLVASDDLEDTPAAGGTLGAAPSAPAKEER